MIIHCTICLVVIFLVGSKASSLSPKLVSRYVTGCTLLSSISRIIMLSKERCVERSLKDRLGTGILDPVHGGCDRGV